MLTKLIVRLYEKLREKCHQNPVDRLRENGAVIGENVHIYDGGGSSIDYCFGHLLKLGNNVTISNTTILLHDAYMQKCRKWISSKPCFDETKLCDEKEHMKNEIEDWGFLL